jgi:hypothetical protein
MQFFLLISITQLVAAVKRILIKISMIITMPNIYLHSKFASFLTFCIAISDFAYFRIEPTGSLSNARGCGDGTVFQFFGALA